MLELSGGSPTMARAIFAAGHMLPAFALILIAAGLGLLLEGDPPNERLLARHASASGSTSRARACSSAARGRFVAGHPGDAAGGDVPCSGGSTTSLSPREYVWLLMGWTVMCAALASTEAEDATEPQKSRPLTSTTPLAASQRSASCSACSAL